MNRFAYEVRYRLNTRRLFNCLTVKYFNYGQDWSKCNIKLRLKDDNYWDGEAI